MCAWAGFPLALCSGQGKEGQEGLVEVGGYAGADAGAGAGAASAENRNADASGQGASRRAPPEIPLEGKPAPHIPGWEGGRRKRGEGTEKRRRLVQAASEGRETDAETETETETEGADQGEREREGNGEEAEEGSAEEGSESSEEAEEAASSEEAPQPGTEAPLPDVRVTWADLEAESVEIANEIKVRDDCCCCCCWCCRHFFRPLSSPTYSISHRPSPSLSLFLPPPSLDNVPRVRLPARPRAAASKEGHTPVRGLISELIHRHHPS